MQRNQREPLYFRGQAAATIGGVARPLSGTHEEEAPPMSPTPGNTISVDTRHLDGFVAREALEEARAGATSVQINTGGACHLDAPMVSRGLEQLPLAELDLLIVENVGNLICPAGTPLGAHVRLVVISVTEGPYAPRKHPVIFNQCQVAVINKIDLADAMEVSVEELVADAHEVNPRMEVVPTNLRSGEGVDEVIAALGL